MTLLFYFIPDVITCIFGHKPTRLMEIDLAKWASFEQEYPAAQFTQATIAEAIQIYLRTPEHESEDLEDLMPVFRALEKLGIVSDIPEFIEAEEDDDEGEEDDDEDENSKD